MEKKKWYKTWWGVLLIIFFPLIAAPIAIVQSKMQTKFKIASIIGVYIAVFTMLAFVPTDETVKKEEATKKKEQKKPAEENKQTVEEKQVEKKSEETEKKIYEPKVTMNQGNGDCVLQIVIPENSTEEEILKILMDTAVAKKKEFRGDNIMVVAYGDEYYMYKDLLGTHGQIRMVNGSTDFIKLAPKESISEEDRKDFKEYFEVYYAIKNAGGSEAEIRKDVEQLLKARNGDRYKEIIKKSEKYFFEINKVKKEAEKYS